ncbi:tautomerase family protein [Streptomyces griseoruber]|uniref:tautomerase family protein n=2 Tax=Streptomyces griseoruber TaxID=1943 RepID=UPI003140A09B
MGAAEPLTAVTITHRQQTSKERRMPFVRIDLIRGRRPEDIRAIADATHQALVDVLAIPERDRFQVITEHPRRQGVGRCRPVDQRAARRVCRAGDLTAAHELSRPHRVV